MPNPFDQFDGGSASNDNPFDQFDSHSGGEPITDYSRERIAAGQEAEKPGFFARAGEGYLSGSSQVMGNIDRASAAALEKVGVHTGGSERYQQYKNWEAAHMDALNTGAGEAGKFAGQVLTTVPLALLTDNPWLVGAGAGGLTTESDTPLGAAKDVGIGAVMGKVGDMAAKGVSRGVGALVDKFSPNPILATSPAGPSVGKRAAQYVAKLMDDSGVTPVDLVQAGSATAKPITSAEIIGRPGTTALGALARRDGVTADALDGLMKQRAMDAPTRMLDDYAAASGIDPKLAAGDIQAYVDAGRARVKPMFDAALGTENGGASFPVWNEKLAELSKRPVIRNAIKAVTDDLSNAGKDASYYGLRTNALGELESQSMPTAEAWDMINKRVGSLAERDAFGRILPDTVSPGNYNINVAKKSLTGAMKDAIPGYADALSESGDYLSLKQAFENGQKFIVDPKTTVAQTTKYLGNLSAPERESFKGGIANQLFEAAQNGRLNSRMFFRTQNGATASVPAVAEKLEAALGRSDAQSFLSNIESEGQMATAAGRMRPGVNSPTAEYTEAMRQQDAPYGANGRLVDFGTDLMTGGPKAAVRGQVANVVRGAAARLKTAGMPTEVRNEAGRLLMMRPDVLGHYIQGAFTPQAPALKALTQSAPLGAALIGSSLAAGAVPASNQ